MTQLSEHFSLDELIFSETATRLRINNRPNVMQVQNLQRLCLQFLEPARIALGQPIIPSSGYRSYALNAATGGSLTSAHMDGRAVDVRAIGMAPPTFTRWFIRFCEKNDLKVDQVIDEFGRWTHIGIAKAGEEPRQQYLIASQDPAGKTVYAPLVLSA